MRVVFDIDGVLCDVWTLVGELIKEDLPAFSWDKAQSYTLDGLSEQEKVLAWFYFEEPRLFATPQPMFDRTATTLNNWEEAKVAPLMKADGTDMQRTTLNDWILFFNQLLDAGVEVILHSMVKDEECAAYRQLWFDHCIKPFVNGVQLQLDIGEKAQLRGNIVVDDCIANIKKADAKYKIMPLMFHNQYNKYNKQYYENDAARDFELVATAHDIQKAILRALSKEGLGV